MFPEIDLHLVVMSARELQTVSAGLQEGTDASPELVSTVARRKAANEGKAMSDGSFPIRNAADLARAIQAFGRAKDKDRAKRWIIKRARELGKTDMLPDSWKVSPAKAFELIGITALDITLPFSADPPQCQFSEFAEGLPKEQKCKFGDESATKRVVWADGRAYIPVCEAHLATARKVIVEDNHDEVTKIMDLALEEFVKAPGPCSLDRSAKHNWVERQGGLPNYICQVARAIARGGRTLDSAIPIAIGTLKKWAAGLGDVSPAVRARAAAAIAQWMKMRAKEKASSGTVETFELDDDDLTLIDMLVFADYGFATEEPKDPGSKTRANSGGNSPEARSKRAYNRHAAGSGSKSGEFAPGKARDDAADKRQKAPGAKELYNKILKDNGAVRGLSDADLKKAVGILYSEKTSDPDVVKARYAASAEMARRGFDIEKHGAKGGGIREKPGQKDVKQTVAPKTHDGSKIVRGPFEDGSAGYADGWTWDPEEAKFISPEESKKRTAAAAARRTSNTVEDEELGAKDTSNIKSRVPNKSNTSGIRRKALPESERPEDKKAAKGTGNSRRRGPYRSSGRTVVRNKRKVVLRLDGKPDGRSLRTNFRRYPSSAPSGLGGQFAPEGRGGRATKKKYGTAASLEGTMYTELAFVPFNVAAVIKQVNAGVGQMTDKQLTTAASVLGKAPADAPGVKAAVAKVSAAIESRKLGTKKSAPAPDKKAAAAEVEELSVGDFVVITAGTFKDETAEIVGKAPKADQFMVRVGERIATVDKAVCEQRLVAVTASGAALWDEDRYDYFWDESADLTVRVDNEEQNVQVFDGSILDWTGTDLTVDEVRKLPQVDDCASLEALVGAGGSGTEEEDVVLAETVAPAPVIVGEAQRVPLKTEEQDEDSLATRTKAAAQEGVEKPEGAGEGGGGKFRIPLLIPENTWSGDRRRFAKGSLEVKEPPFPLLWQRETDDGHKKSVIVGRVDKAEVLENGGIGNLEGVFDTHPDAVEAARQVKGRFVTTVSGDVDKFDHELAQNDEGKETIEIKHGRVVAATIVAKPAFQEAVIEYVPEEGEEAMVASGAPGAGPLHPSQAWFAPPVMTEPYMFKVEDDGRCHGLIAQWDTAHTGNPNWKAPKNFSGYRYFNRKPVRTAEGSDVRCGQLTLTGGHPELGLDPDAVVRHYDDTRSAVADVVVGENEFGIWAAGATRPDVSPEQIRAFRGSEPSGDWRMRDGELELLAVCMVNTPGFPVMQPRALVASGNKVVALVAAGMPSHVRKVDLHAQVEQLSAQLAVLQSAYDTRLATLEAEGEARRRMELQSQIAASCA